jgi:hypothetical protein
VVRPAGVRHALAGYPRPARRADRGRARCFGIPRRARLVAQVLQCIVGQGPTSPTAHSRGCPARRALSSDPTARSARGQRPPGRPGRAARWQVVQAGWANLWVVDLDGPLVPKARARRRAGAPPAARRAPAARWRGCIRRRSRPWCGGARIPFVDGEGALDSGRSPRITRGLQPEARLLRSMATSAWPGPWIRSSMARARSSELGAGPDRVPRSRTAGMAEAASGGRRRPDGRGREGSASLMCHCPFDEGEFPTRVAGQR